MIGLLPLIAGLVLWLATKYVTLGVVLTVVGGGLAVIQAVFMATVFLVAAKIGKRAKVSWF